MPHRVTDYYEKDSTRMNKQRDNGFIECDYCGELFVEGEPFCPYCGKTVEEIIKTWQEKGKDNNSHHPLKHSKKAYSNYANI